MNVDEDQDWAANRMDGKVTIQSENEETAELSGYRKNLPKYVLFHATAIVFVGIPYLFGHWRPQWQVRCTMSKSTQGHHSDFLIQCQLDGFARARVVP